MSTSSTISKRHPFASPLKLLPVLIIILVMLLSACGGQASPAAGSSSQSAPAASGAPVSFSKDVLPILQSRCVNCHGGQRTQKGLDMTSYAKLMQGSENGAVVSPGDVAHSSFIQMILQGKMPKSGPKLLPSQIQMLTNWVQAGALNN